MNLDAENSDDLGFAIAALGCQAITIDEFKEWVMHVISNYEYPNFFLDLLEVNSMLDIFKVIRFSPSLKNREKIEPALYGIAYNRFGTLYEPSVSKAVADSSLNKNYNISQRFQSVFPFINFNF